MRRVWLLLLSIIALTAGRAEVAGAASMVLESESSYVLHSRDADVLWHPASLTKMMTVLLVFEALRAGELALSDTVPISPAAAAQPPTKLGLSPGRTIGLETAIQATILRSANDAAVVLAEAVAGSEEAFAVRMTERAHRLGMASTIYRNASGLPDAQQVTTARDTAVLARHILLEMPEYAGYFAGTGMTRGNKRLPTFNGFLTSFEGASGMKTGFTCASGYNIVASATREGRTLIGILLGASNRASRMAEIHRLMNNGFETHWAEASRPASLSDLVREAPEEPAGPPSVIPRSNCPPGNTPKAAESDQRLPGWGILIGSFNARAHAEAAVRRHRENVGTGDRAGRPVILQRRRGSARGYSVLIVDLSRMDAQGACLALRSRKSYCLALAPNVLNNPRALWR